MYRLRVGQDDVRDTMQREQRRSSSSSQRPGGQKFRSLICPSSQSQSTLRGARREATQRRKTQVLTDLDDRLLRSRPSRGQAGFSVNSPSIMVSPLEATDPSSLAPLPSSPSCSESPSASMSPPFRPAVSSRLREIRSPKLFASGPSTRITQSPSCSFLRLAEGMA